MARCLCVGVSVRRPLQDVRICGGLVDEDGLPPHVSDMFARPLGMLRPTARTWAPHAVVQDGQPCPAGMQMMAESFRDTPSICLARSLWYLKRHSPNPGVWDEQVKELGARQGFTLRVLSQWRGSGELVRSPRGGRPKTLPEVASRSLDLHRHQRHFFCEGAWRCVREPAALERALVRRCSREQASPPLQLTATSVGTFALMGTVAALALDRGEVRLHSKQCTPPERPLVGGSVATNRPDGRT